MPALVIFGRRWRIGPDDLPIPVLIYITFHVPAVLTLIILQVLSRTQQNDDSDPSEPGSYLTADNTTTTANQTETNEKDPTPECQNLSNLYNNVLLCIYGLEIIFESIILRVSLKGTIMDDSKRKNLNIYIYLRFFIGFFELISYLVSILILFFADEITYYILIEN